MGSTTSSVSRPTTKSQSHRPGTGRIAGKQFFKITAPDEKCRQHEGGGDEAGYEDSEHEISLESLGSSLQTKPANSLGMIEFDAEEPAGQLGA